MSPTVCEFTVSALLMPPTRGSGSSLYETFVEHFTKLLNEGCSKDVNRSSDCADEDDSYSSMPPVTETEILLDSARARMKNILETEDVYDSILSGLMLDQYVEGMTEPVTAATPEECDLKLLMNIVEGSGIQSIIGAINSAISPNIREKYEYVCQKLIDILKTDYHLEESLVAMRKYFLMENGDILFHFYSQVFDKVCVSGWGVEDEMNINIILEDTLLSYCPEDVSKLSIRIDDSLKRRILNKIDTYKPIVLVYNITWPLDIIINTACRERYSKIFAFLLQIKQAKYRLDELRFHELSPSNLTGRRHSLSTQQYAINTKKTLAAVHLFRVKLLYFVNTLHSHLMSRILHSTEPILHKLLDSTTSDLQMIISAHEEYVKNIYEQSLLNPRIGVLKENIVKILNLALVFCECWRGGVNNISWEILHEMDEDIMKCQRFLRGFVGHLAPKGNLNYLESLVEDLVAQKETPLLFF